MLRKTGEQRLIMRPEEADTLTNWVLELGVGPGNVGLNIGSSTKHFREPHIHDRFIGPLERRGSASFAFRGEIVVCSDLLNPRLEIKLA